MTQTYNDPKINNGIPEAMSKDDLKPFALIMTKWEDTDDEVMMVIDVEERHPTFKGEFSINCLTKNRDEQRIVQTQIVSLIKPYQNISDLIFR